MMNSYIEARLLSPVAKSMQRVALLLNPMVNISTKVLVGSNVGLPYINEKTVY